MVLTQNPGVARKLDDKVRAWAAKPGNEEYAKAIATLEETFTEARKTQAYLAELLSDHGFRGQVVLLNGTNTDASSRQIYTAYKARHQARWDQVSSGSKTADMKAAIVEEFAAALRQR